MARWHEKLQDYNFKIIHIAGKSNGPADALSRMHQKDEDKEPKSTPLLPADAFLNVFKVEDPGTLEHKVIEARKWHELTMKQWEKTLLIEKDEGLGSMAWRNNKQHLVVPLDDVLKRRILRELHNHWGVGHLGHDKIIRRIQWSYFWPSERAIEQYITGCTTCQQNKNLTHIMKTLLYKIPVPENTPPFTQIAMDLITGLPPSWGYDAILTIVDHRCSWGAVFLPCNTTITGPQITQLYYKHIYP